MAERDRSPALPALPCACATLRRAARAVTQMYSRAMAESGMEITQFTLLQAMSRVGPMTQKRLGEILALDSTTLSRSLRLLETQGWIASAPGRDRRERHWQISASGKRKMREMEPAWQRAQDELRQALGASGWESMMKASDAVSAAALGV